MCVANRAFSLVELSIVLVILGLLTGGILTGQSLIESATMRRQLADIATLQSATLSFRDKYMAIPGDMPIAQRFWAATTEPDRVNNGNGNGQIDNHNSTPITPCDINTPVTGLYNSPETANFYDHLAMSGIYNFPAYDAGVRSSSAPPVTNVVFPQLRFQSRGSTSDAAPGGVLNPQYLGVLYVPGCQHISSGNKITLGLFGGNGVVVSSGQSAGINPWEAEYFDTKLDDGMPRSGKVAIANPNSSYIYRNITPSGPDQTPCAMWGGTTNTAYRTENSLHIGGGGIPLTRGCALLIDAGF